MNKMIVRITFNTLLGLILIYAWTRFVDVGEVWQKLSTANPLVILGVCGALVIATFFRALRFKLLLKDKKISLTQIALLTYLGQLLSFVIPLRLGEFAKGLYISNQSKTPVTQSILWVFVDRLVDFWVVMSLIAVLLFIVPTAVPSQINLTIAALAGIVSVGLVLTVYYPKLIKQIALAILSLIFIKRLRIILTDFATSVIDSFIILKVPPLKQLMLIGVTAFSWIFESLTWYVVFIGLGGTITAEAIILGTMLMALTFLLPSAPGFLGSLQAAGLLVFGLWFGLDPVLVSAATVLMHLSIVCYVLVVGLTALYLLKLDLTDLFKQFSRTGR